MYKDLETPTLVLLLREARLERKELQAKEYEIRTEINSRSYVIAPENYPKKQYELTTSETLEIGRMLAQQRTTKDWCEYIEQLINKRK
jgi:hypothetical protein